VAHDGDPGIGNRSYATGDPRAAFALHGVTAGDEKRAGVAHRVGVGRLKRQEGHVADDERALRSPADGARRPRALNDASVATVTFFGALAGAICAGSVIDVLRGARRAPI
jgi:hypothetical protein